MIEGNTIRIIVIVASKSCAQGRKATADDHADASSLINDSTFSYNPPSRGPISSNRPPRSGLYYVHLQ